MRDFNTDVEEKHSKRRMPKVELGKRSYFDRDQDSYQEKSRSRASKNQSRTSDKIENTLSYSATGFPLEGFSGGQWDGLFKENYAHNNLQNFDAFNLINNNFSNSITMVKGMIEDLGKESRRNFDAQMGLFSSQSQNGMFLNNNHINLPSINMFNFTLNQNGFGSNTGNL